METYQSGKGLNPYKVQYDMILSHVEELPYCISSGEEEFSSELLKAENHQLLRSVSCECHVTFAFLSLTSFS